MSLSVEEYMALGAREIVSGVKKKRFTAEEVVTAALRRVRETDKTLGAFLCVLEEAAIAKAREVDGNLAAGRDPGPLAGVPVALKDNLTLAGAPTTCASKMLAGYEPPYTATAVQQVLDAGGIPLGKTNLDEFAMGSSTENSAFQRTKNPWDTARVPGGSSGGSAVAVAACCVPAALGSDTGGSIRQPAAFCGVTGMKPTYGAVSRYGLVAFASSLDQVGVFARDAADAALLLSVIVGPDERDATCRPLRRAEDLAAVSATGENGEKPLAGKKIGLPKEYFFTEGLDPETERAVRAAVEVLGKLGAETKAVSLPHTAYAVATYYIIAPAEASSNLARYDGVHYGFRTADSLAGKDRPALVRLYEKSRAEGLGAEVKRRIMLGTFVLAGGYYDAYYLKAQKVRTLIRGDFDRVFAEVDVVAAPTTPAPAFRFGEKSEPLAMYLADVFTLAANLAALPALSVPCGFSAAGLPAGLQLIGSPGADAELLRGAAAFQSVTDFHRLRPPAL